MHGEQMMCKAVEKAYYDQNQSVTYHYRLIADAVNQLADQR